MVNIIIPSHLTLNTLCLDLGLHTGWASFNVKTQSVDSGAVNLNKCRKFYGKGVHFELFFNFLNEKIEELKCNGEAEVFFEDVAAHLGTDAAHMFGGFRAILYLVCQQKMVGVTGIPVGTIKKMATGKGSAKKEKMIEAVINAGYSVYDHNQADALAMLLFSTPYPFTEDFREMTPESKDNSQPRPLN